MSVTSSFPSQPLCQVPQKQQQLVYPVSASASPNRRARSSIQTENPAVSTNNTTTTNAIRRLSDSNVRSIFECLYSNKPPPADLQFVIVPVGPNGEKLSPPSYEFDDGLYVLLRPDKQNGNNNPKKKGQAFETAPRAPDHLRHLVMQQIPPETCPWSLSGPQFPQPTAIQQRYCYPKGRPEYSNRKGGALWTMFGADGKEDKEFRLLHVYYSAKRATNKALSSSMTPSEVGSPDREATSPSMRSPPRKRAVTHHYNNSQSTSPSTSNLVSHPMRQVPQLTERVFAHSPAITSSSTNSCSVPSSPLTPEISLPLSQVYTMPTSNGRGTTTLNNRNISARTFPVWPEQMIVTPINDIQVSNVKFPQSPPGEIKEQRLYRTYSDESSQLPTGFQSPSPFRRPIASSPPTSRTINVQRSPLFRTGEYYTGATASLLGGNIDSYQLDSFDRLDDTSVSTGGRSDPFTKEILDLPLQFDSESFWNEPFLAISQTPSLDPSIIVDDIFGTKQRERQDNLSSHLRAYQQHIRDEVLAAPEAEQPQLVSLMASWARTVAEDPLSIRAPPLLKRFPSPLPRALSPPTRFDPPYNSSKDGHETDRVVDDVSVDHIVVASV